MCRQEHEISKINKKNPALSYKEAEDSLKSVWDKNCTYDEMDFLDAVQKFFHLPIQDALLSDNYIIKVLAILDRRVGKRTLNQISSSKEYVSYPEWVQQFYLLRLEFEKLNI